MNTEDKKIQDIQIINFEKIKEIQFVEKQRPTVDWVLWGDDNLYPIYIQNLLNESSINKAIIESKVNYIFGKGLKKEFQANAEETGSEVLKKCIYDYVVFGGYAINVIKNKVGGSLYYHIPIQKIRSGKKVYNEKTKQKKVEKYYYSNDWANYRRNENYPEAISAFSVDSKENSQLMFFKNYAINSEYYPIPSYSSTLKYIKMDGMIATFWDNALSNGMNPSMSITFVGPIPSEDEKKRTKRKLEDTYCGPEKTARIIVNFTEDVTQKPIIDTITPPQLDKQFTVLKGLVTDNIIYGHQLTSPLLAGIKTPGQLGGNNELLIAFGIYNMNVIEPSRTECLNSFQKVTGIKKLEIEKRDPISFQFSENIMKEIMTKDELRAQIGLAPFVDETSVITE